MDKVRVWTKINVQVDLEFSDLNKNVNFTNAQKDTFPAACIVVSRAEWEEVESSKSIKSITRTTGDNYELEESREESEDAGVSEIKFMAEYWSNAAKMQQSCRPYILEGKGGELEFVIEFDDEWVSKFNAIQGTETQKVSKLCEMYLTQVVIPELKA